MAFIVTPPVGRPFAVKDVAVIEPDSNRLAEPGPFVPRERKYAVTPVPGVHMKVAEDPGKTLPDAGLVNVAGVAAWTVSGRQKNETRDKREHERTERRTE